MKDRTRKRKSNEDDLNQISIFLFVSFLKYVLLYVFRKLILFWLFIFDQKLHDIEISDYINFF